jgi:subtilisin family serine protease
MSVRWGVVGVVLAVACAEPPEERSDSGGPPLLDEQLARRLGDGEVTTVVVTLDHQRLPALPAQGVRRGERVRALRERASRVLALGEPLVAELPDDAVLVRQYEHFPQVALELASLDAADWLLEQDLVTAVEADVLVEAYDTTSLALIGQPAATTSGFTGAGTAVAVLDTGADWTHPDLGSCTAVGVPSTCRVKYAADLAPSDGVRDTNGHGTNVSAIVALVAPGTDILALDVFNGNLGYSTDILAALDWVVANQATYDIAAVNMSLGSGAFTAPCTDVFSSAITTTRAANVAVVVASGNNAYTNAVGSPACNGSAVTVGAVYDSNLGAMGWSGCSDTSSAADKVTCFSNSASFLDVLAPGALITAGGYTMGGTSQASPHVAGAMAVLRAANPSDTLDQLEATLETTGVLVTDTRNGLVFPRIDLASAVSDCIDAVSPLNGAAGGDGGTGTFDIDAGAGCSWTVTPQDDWISVDVTAGNADGQVTWTAELNHGGARIGYVDVSGRAFAVEQEAAVPPEGTVQIAGGAAGTRLAAVELTLDSAEAAEVCVSNTTTCSAWVPYAPTMPWTLSSGAGTKTVTVWFRDAWDNTSEPASDTIALDTAAPTNGQLTATPGDGELTLSWTGFADAGSGVESYVLVQATGTVAPSNCTGPAVWTGTAGPATVTGLVNGTTYAFRVCAVDGAGNLSAGAVTTGRPVPETDAPVGTISLAAGADWTRVTAITATLAATDASGVTHACLSNTSTCTSWFAMTTSKAWTLPGGPGTKTVYASFKDTWGNVSTAVTDTIGLDQTVPGNGTLTAVPASGQATLSWTGFTDSGSGVASYVLVQSATATAPSSCAGASVWSGSDLTVTRTGLTNGTTYAWRLCAVDAAGNRSTGAVISTRPAPEFVPPTGTISLNAGADWTSRTAVTATLVASDASGVTHACLSNSATCTSWFAMTGSKPWTLSTGSGTKTVYASFKDTWGNVSTAVSDTIQLDTQVPTNGTVTATGSSGQVVLAWAGFADANSGLASYAIAQAVGTTAPANCSGVLAWTGTATTATLTGLTDGTTYAYRVCAVDVAGNRSTGTTLTARPAPEYVAPTGTVVLAAGDAWTKTTTITATLSATDTSGVTHACLSNTSTCTAFFAWTPSKSWTLSGASGTKTVYASFKDTYGNVSTVVSDTIGLDSTFPVNGTVSATAGTGQATLSFSGFTDAHSGVASYVVVQATGSTAPSNCAGAPVWTGTTSPATVTGLTAGTSYAFRLCALDTAGNRSTGAVALATPN